jgi:hypothetical protein
MGQVELLLGDIGISNNQLIIKNVQIRGLDFPYQNSLLLG